MLGGEPATSYTPKYDYNGSHVCCVASVKYPKVSLISEGRSGQHFTNAFKWGDDLVLRVVGRQGEWTLANGSSLKLWHAT